MQLKKKAGFLLLAGTLAMMVIGCGGDPNGPPSRSPSPSSSVEPDVTLHAFSESKDETGVSIIVEDGPKKIAQFGNSVVILGKGGKVLLSTDGGQSFTTQTDVTALAKRDAATQITLAAVDIKKVVSHDEGFVFMGTKKVIVTDGEYNGKLGLTSETNSDGLSVQDINDIVVSGQYLVIAQNLRCPVVDLKAAAPAKVAMFAHLSDSDNPAIIAPLGKVTVLGVGADKTVYAVNEDATNVRWYKNSGLMDGLNTSSKAEAPNLNLVAGATAGWVNTDKKVNAVAESTGKIFFLLDGKYIIGDLSGAMEPITFADPDIVGFFEFTLNSENGDVGVVIAAKKNVGLSSIKPDTGELVLFLSRATVKDSKVSVDHADRTTAYDIGSDTVLAIFQTARPSEVIITDKAVHVSVEVQGPKRKL